MAQVENPRDHGGWVTDQVGAISADDVAAMDARIDALHRDLGVEVAVVLVDDVDAASPKAFATALFNAWEIGDAEANNGLLVLMVMGQRRLEMETGYGLEGVLPDGWLGSMQAARMVPAFRDGDIGRGLREGLGAVDERLREHPDDARLGTAGPIAIGAKRARTMSAVGAVGGVGVTGGFVALFVVAVRRSWRQARTCEKCGLFMPLLDEAAEDAHLDDGQQAEERLGSVDWQVHQCTACGEVRLFPHQAWFSGYSSCPKCSYRTLKATTVTEVAATQYSGGRVRVTEDCRHCDFHRTSTRATPRLPPPSSTSSSSSGSSSFGGGGGGGGSFGGGHSGGGGAGSSW
ncbi:MAG: TPM domain-containing protein [Myxococcota bacterium]